MRSLPDEVKKPICREFGKRQLQCKQRGLSVICLIQQAVQWGGFVEQQIRQPSIQSFVQESLAAVDRGYLRAYFSTLKLLKPA